MDVDVLREIGMVQQLAADRGTPVYLVHDGDRLIVDAEPGSPPTYLVQPNGQVRWSGAGVEPNDSPLNL